jgi:hypothetical protein
VFVILTLIFVGGGLIALTYGPQALLIGLLFLLGGAALILILWLLLKGIEKLRDRMVADDGKALQQYWSNTSNRRPEHSGIRPEKSYNDCRPM